MSELRLNLITREWVIVAAERARRPHEFRTRRDKKVLPEYLDICPFCAGNESRTPDEILRVPAGNDWLLRATPNRFSALSLEGARDRRNEGIRHRVSGVGRHAVLIESPLHNVSIPAMTNRHVTEIMKAYRELFSRAYEDERIDHVIIFKNHGEGSGTSIRHSHSQVVGVPVTPMQVRTRIEEAMRYFDHTGECLMCSTLRDEIGDGRRIVLETPHFAVFVPYAALSPFHTWIFPKRHCAAFSAMTDEEAADLAFCLRTILAKFSAGLEDPDYNLVLRSENPKEGRSEYFHWYISIVPRVMQATGFELGSGMYVNSAIPEEIAEFLRSTAVELSGD